MARTTFLTDPEELNFYKLAVDVASSSEWAAVLKKCPTAAHAWLVLVAESRGKPVKLSVKQISDFCRVNRSTAQHALKFLEDAGWLIRHDLYDNQTGARLPNIYRVIIPKPSEGKP